MRPLLVVLVLATVGLAAPGRAAVDGLTAPADFERATPRATSLLAPATTLAQLQGAPPDTTGGATEDPEEGAAAREEALEVYRRDERSARAAIVMSLVFPGWGQLYADVPFWSVVGFAVQAYYLGNILLERRRVERQRVLRDQAPVGSPLRSTRDALVKEHQERIRDFIWWAGGGVLILSLDAYVSVQLVDFDSDDPPTPDLDRDWDQPDESGEGLALRLDFSF